MSASRPVKRCERFSLVETCTVSAQRRSAACGARGVGRRGDEVAAQPDEHLRAARVHRLDRVDGVEPVPARRLEAELGAERVEERRGVGRSQMPIVRSPCTLLWPRTGHGPAPGRPMFPRSSSRFTISWTFATPCSCCVSPMAQQAMTALRARVELRQLAHLRRAGLPRARSSSASERCVERGAPARRSPACASAMNSRVEHACPAPRPPARAAPSPRPGAAPRRRRRAPARTRRREACRRPSRPSGSCGFANATRPRSRSGLMLTIAQPRRFAACSTVQHARVVRARVLTEHEDRVAELEVGERDRALAFADRLAQPRAARLVTHVRAVGQVVRAELAREQLAQERGLVARAPGGVEHRLVAATPSARR